MKDINILATPGRTADLLRRFGLRPTKRLGQNFLIDANVQRKILAAAKLSTADRVLEIGPGIGALTTSLAKVCKHVTAVEIDRRLLPVLNEVTSSFANVNILSLDALKLKHQDLVAVGDKPNMLISNLPYNIAAPLLIKYLEDFDFIESYTVMVQREIADRILSAPGGKDYGAYTIKLRFLADAKLAFYVSRQVFMPPPRVDSAVIKLIRRQKDDAISRAPIFKLIDAAFSQRRKKLVNAVSDSLSMDKRLIVDSLIELGLSPETRAEALTLDDFIRLSAELALS